MRSLPPYRSPTLGSRRRGVLPLALGALTVPLGRTPSDLQATSRSTVQKQISSAHDDLEDSSAPRTTRHGPAGGGARRAGRARRGQWCTVRGRLDAARVARRARCRSGSTAAVERLDSAEADLAGRAGRPGRCSGRWSPTWSTRIYQSGDPELLAFPRCSRRRGPTDLTRQAECSRRDGRAARPAPTTTCAPPRCCSRSARSRSRRPRDEVAVQRRRPPSTWSTMRGPGRAGARGEGGRRRRWSSERPRRQAGRRAQARQHDLRELREAARARGAADQAADPRRRRRKAARRAAASTAPTGGFLTARSPATSPRRSATARTRSTATTRSTTAPTSAPAAASRCTPPPAAR